LRPKDITDATTLFPSEAASRSHITGTALLVDREKIGTLNVQDQKTSADDPQNARREFASPATTIAGLPDLCREVLTLRKLHGLSQRAIAERLGVSERTVEKHVAYGVRLCADRMFARGAANRLAISDDERDGSSGCRGGKA